MNKWLLSQCDTGGQLAQGPQPKNSATSSINAKEYKVRILFLLAYY